MVARIQIRRDTAADWTSVNPVLSGGEIGYESDTDKAKIGDGATTWNSLPYFIYRPTFAEVLSKPTTIAGFGITDAFNGQFSSLTGKPTTLAGYGITDAITSLSFAQLTGKPSTLAGYGITDAFSGAFSALSGRPTTLAGYGITDAAGLASPAFTGTPTAPTAALTTNNTQIATTAFVKGKVEQSILTSSKIYVQDNEPSFNAFDEIWIETDTGSIYKSVAGTTTVPLDSSLVSSSSSNITIPAAGASDTRLSLTAGPPSGSLNLSPSVFLESFSTSAGSNGSRCQPV